MLLLAYGFDFDDAGMSRQHSSPQIHFQLKHKWNHLWRQQLHLSNVYQRAWLRTDELLPSSANRLKWLRRQPAQKLQKIADMAASMSSADFAVWLDAIEDTIFIFSYLRRSILWQCGHFVFMFRPRRHHIITVLISSRWDFILSAE